MKNIYKWYQRAIYAVGIFFILAIVVLIAIQVLSRYLNFTASWTEELARYAFLQLTVFGSAAAFHDQRHIHIDSFIGYAPPKVQTAVRILVDCLIIFLMGLFFKSMLKVMSGTAKISLASIPSLGVNVMYTIVEVAMVLIILSNVLDIVRIFYKPLDEAMSEAAMEGKIEEDLSDVI